ncbi:hypothetical protein [Klebsiella quasipneumoniae]|uniref:hypothetical protein n=1 Tax=Klebsiella quasipneumoniae TaxID=1463165 RepID=UPI000BAE3F2D|nr:hypothetical protein [Klebsiella quasipneumoniae]MDK1925391.1 hypothetical protein [Klebsiella sp. K4-41]PAX29745.1 hypothetical protein CLI88_26985 [Klebsiella pneumoniae]MCS4418686.1 hypothetical protein [Klebsiella quasipneumoniae subsp. similipneumoniae]HBX2589299.1 hypothetical protein [Klebsiella pneumoniae]HCQ0119713.1 hypothetical protein [Klebsiella pneumoniae]
MIELTLKEYNAIHTDYRDVWSTERTDWPDWESVRELYMGKRTIMKHGSLLIEGLHFQIKEAP